MMKLLSIYFCKALAVLALVFLLAACNFPGSTQSGKDSPEAVYTQAAQTVQAALTAQGPRTTPTQPPAALPTVSIPTQAPPPSNPTQAPPSNPTQPPAPAPTSTIKVDDAAQFVSQSPSDGTSIPAGQAFKTVWVLKNVGKTTWTTQYHLRPFIQVTFGGPAQVFLPKEVKPGEEVSIEVPMTAPDSLGEQKTIWVLTNATGVNFFPLDLTIKIITAPTATPKPNLTATAQYCLDNPGSCPTATP